MKIGFIGFGSVASAFMLGFREGGGGPFAFYKHGAPPPYTGLSARRLAKTGALFCEPAELASECSLLFSCVVGSATLEVAETFAPYLTNSHLYVDLNTTSPETKRAAAKIVENAGAAYADGAIMGPVELMRHRVPVIAAGSGASLFAARCAPLGMDITVLEGAAGDAAIVKLLRSVFQKGLAAVLLETSLAARSMGVQNAVLDSIFKTYGAMPLRAIADALVSKAVIHAGRMSREMEEVERMLEEQKTRCTMTDATLKTYRWCASLNAGVEAGAALPSTLDDALALIEKIAGMQREQSCLEGR